MKGADVWLIHKAGGGVWAVTDAMAFDFARPVSDKVQDEKLRSMSYSAKQQVWTAIMSRKLKTCDAASDLPIDPGLSTYLLYAFGSSASKAGVQGIMYHGTDNRGNRLDMLVAAKVSQGLVAAAAAAAAADVPAQPLPTAAEIAQAVDAIVTSTAAPWCGSQDRPQQLQQWRCHASL